MPFDISIFGQKIVVNEQFLKWGVKLQVTIKTKGKTEENGKSLWWYPAPSLPGRSSTAEAAFGLNHVCVLN